MNQLKVLGNTQPLSRAGNDLIYIDKGRYLLIGGVSRQNNEMKELNDFWMLHLPHKDGDLAGLWQELKFENQAIYTPRSSQKACYDGVNLIYIFGGQKFIDNHSTDEFLCVNLQKKTITIQPQKNRPKARNSHTMNYYNGKIYLFGGANDDGPLNDFHVYDIALQEWQCINEIPDQLSAREMHTAHIITTMLQQTPMKGLDQYKMVEIGFGIDSQDSPEKVQNSVIQDIVVQQNEVVEQVIVAGDCHDYLFLIGGRFKDRILNEICAINLQTYEVQLVAQLPFPLCAHSSVNIADKIYILGGFDGTGLSKEIILLHNQTLMKQGQLKEGVMALSALYSQDINKIVIFGGCTLESDNNNVFIVQI